MIFLTNGSAQDLPANQQFDFWKTQEDWSRAVKVAQIRQAEVLGPSIAPHHEFLLNVLLEAVTTDKTYAFTSRPRGQAVDWCRWAEFCKYFFLKNASDQQQLMDQLRRGEVYAWYPPFAGWAAEDARWPATSARYCCDSDQRVDATVYWPFGQFDRKTCQTTRTVPETWPSPEDLAKFGEMVEWVSYKFGPDVAKNLVESPPTAEERAASFAPTRPPSPVPEEPEPEHQPPSGTSILAVFGITFAVLLTGALLLASTPQKPERQAK